MDGDDEKNTSCEPQAASKHGWMMNAFLAGRHAALFQGIEGSGKVMSNVRTGQKAGPDS